MVIYGFNILLSVCTYDILYTIFYSFSKLILAVLFLNCYCLTFSIRFVQLYFLLCFCWFAHSTDSFYTHLLNLESIIIRFSLCLFTIFTILLAFAIGSIVRCYYFKCLNFFLLWVLICMCFFVANIIDVMWRLL